MYLRLPRTSSRLPPGHVRHPYPQAQRHEWPGLRAWRAKGIDSRLQWGPGNAPLLTTPEQVRLHTTCIEPYALGLGHSLHRGARAPVSMCWPVLKR